MLSNSSPHWTILCLTPEPQFLHLSSGANITHPTYLVGALEDRIYMGEFCNKYHSMQTEGWQQGWRQWREWFLGRLPSMWASKFITQSCKLQLFKEAIWFKEMIAFPSLCKYIVHAPTGVPTQINRLLTWNKSPIEECLKIWLLFLQVLILPGTNVESWDDDKPCCNLSAAFALLIKPCALVPIQNTGLVAGFPRGVPVAYGTICFGAPITAMVKFESLVPIFAHGEPSAASFLWFLILLSFQLLSMAPASSSPLVCLTLLSLPVSLVLSCILQGGLQGTRE